MSYRFPTGPAWRFRTKRFEIGLTVSRIPGYRYDGDDEDGETQAKLDSGEYVAFSSLVYVELDGVQIASDSLWGSVYLADSVPDFWQAHRDPNPDNRNTLERRARRECIGHYFPDMVREAIREAREHVRSQKPLPYIREGA